MSANVDALLRKRLAEVSHHIAAIEGEFQHEMDDDFAEQAVDRADDEPLDALERALRREAGDIERALARLAGGDYGYCATCGEAIDPARLEALPEARLCIACASKH